MPRSDPGAPPGTEGISPARRTVLSVFLLCTAGLCLWSPARSLFVDGIFRWSVEQPATRQGGLELFALYLLVGIAAGTVRRRTLFGAALLVPLSLYLRRHHVDLAVAGSLVYIEALIGVGAAVERAFRARQRTDTASYLRWFLTGVSVWSLVIVAASLMGAAAPAGLRTLLTAIAVPALTYARRPPLTVHLFRRSFESDRPGRWIDAFFIVFLAGLFARTNAAPDHDSLWYGFRSHLVLAPEGSIFDRVGLVASVHYYPKLFEALVLPLADLGDFSLVAGLNLGALALLALTSYVLACRSGLRPLWSKAVAALVITLPAAAGVAVGAKPDVFAALLLALATLFFWRFVAESSWSDAALGLAAVCLAWATKLTSLPYGALLVAGSAGLWAWRRRSGVWRPSGEAWRPAAWFTLCISVAVGIAFTLRTLLLAGVPTVAPIQLWTGLGLHLKPPVGVLVRDRAADWTGASVLAHEFLWAPDALPHVRTTWTGNAWLWLLLAAGVFALARGGRRRPLGPAAAWIPVIVAGVFFALFYNNSTDGGDGNYYVYPVVLMIVLSVRAATARVVAAAPWIGLLAAGFVAQQAVISFVTCQWDPGTRVLDLDFTRTAFDTRATRKALLRRNGLDDIASFLERDPGVERVVGYGPEPVLRWLPARFESLRVASFYRPELHHRPDALVRYFHENDIELLVVPRVRRSGAVPRALAFLEVQPDARVLEDDLYRLVDLRAVRHRLPELADRLPKTTPTTVHHRLHEHLERARMTGQGRALAPWRKRIAPIDPQLQLFTGRRGWIMHAGTALRFSFDLPDDSGLELTTQIGFHPSVVVDAVGDGVELSIVATSPDVGARRSWRRELGPGDGFVPARLDLAPFGGHRVEIEIAVEAFRGRDDRQDWVVWVGPRIESPAEAEPAGPGDYRSALRPPR